MTTPDTPLRLTAAIKEAFPNGGMTVSGLRREAARGTLVIERIAGKDFTTLAAIEEMRKLCRVVPKDQDSGFNRRVVTAPRRQFGASETDRSNEAQERAQAKLAALKRPCATTSTPKARRAAATAIPLKS